MPQPLSPERGSALVGALALSLVMSMAAAGFMLIAANSSKDQDFASRDITLHYAAESGLQIGARWMRNHDSVFFANQIGEDFIITADTSVAESGNFQTVDGFDRIKIRLNLRSNPKPRILQCLATAGKGQDTLQLAWQIDSIANVTGPSTFCKPILSAWREAVYPGKP